MRLSIHYFANSELGGATYTLSYDAENRMVGVTGTGINVAFTYDADGKRVQQVLNGTTTKFIGSHYEVEGTTIRKYYFAGSTRVAMRTGTNAPVYFLQDHLGSTSITTDASGNLVSQLWYKAWGEVRYTYGNTPTNYTYTGQYSNTADFGLMYYGARWYDSSLGRFSQADSIIPGAGNPQAYDRYNYGFNNPSKYTDPTGHIACWDNNYDSRCNLPENNPYDFNDMTSQQIVVDTSIGNEDYGNKDDEVTLPTREEFNENVAQGYSNYPPLEKMKSGISVAETAFGLFLFISGGMVIALGGVIMAISVVELGGGTLTGPAAPLVFAHAGAGLAIGGIMAASGVFILTSGAYMIIVGVTGKNP